MNCGHPKDTALRVYLLIVGPDEGTRALTCTVVEVNSNLTVIVVVVFCVG